MQAAASKHDAIRKLITAAVRGELTDAQALRLCKQEPGIVALALLAAGQCIAELQANARAQAPSPSTPSGMVPGCPILSERKGGDSPIA